MRIKERLTNFTDKIFSSKEKCQACEAKTTGFDLLGPFNKYVSDRTRLSREAATAQLQQLLLLNMRSYTQEAVGGTVINQIATQAKKEETGWHFTDTYYEDVSKGWLASIGQTQDQEIKDRYTLEIGSWMKVWHQHLALVDDLPDKNPEEVTSKLLKKGFSLLSQSQGLLVSKSLAALFPQIKEGQKIEAYQSPQPLMVASPNFKHYHRGETTIARYSRLYYLPEISEFVILEDGLFTAYSNEQIAQFLSWGQAEDLPNKSEEFFVFVAVLGDQLASLAPHAIFQLVIDKLGFFPEIPIGDNVVVDKERNYDTQLDLIIRLFELEYDRQQEFQSSMSAQQRLKQMTQVIEHSLLRANDLDVFSLLQDYLAVFSPEQETHSKKDKNQFGLRVMKSYPDFMVRVQSLIDCGSGSILGGVQRLSPTQLSGVLGVDRLNVISQLSGKNITNRSEFNKLAKSLGKDTHRFTSLGKCGNCGAKTFLGECGWCVLCEYKDDLGINQNLNWFGEKKSSKQSSIQGKNRGSGYSVGLSDFVAGLLG